MVRKLIGTSGFLLLFLRSLWAQEAFNLLPGDFLFQDSDCGAYCDAIEKVTVGYQGASFSHMGLVVNNEKDPGQLYLIEAISKGVVLTPLDTFLNRSVDRHGAPKVLAGRLKPEFQYLIPTALREAFTLIGHAYDPVYDITDDRYYCSEMVYEVFKRANHNQPVFELQPMTFVDPDTGATFPIWEGYFKELGVPLPEGEPGINPGGISLSEKLTMVHAFGKPDGWQVP